MIYDLAVRNLRYSNYSLNMCLLTEVVILAIRSKVIVYNCRSRAGSHFYGTEYEIWADFGPVGNTEKKFGADYVQMVKMLSYLHTLVHQYYGRNLAVSVSVFLLSVMPKVD